MKVEPLAEKDYLDNKKMFSDLLDTIYSKQLPVSINLSRPLVYLKDKSEKDGIASYEAKELRIEINVYD